MFFEKNWQSDGYFNRNRLFGSFFRYLSYDLEIWSKMSEENQDLIDEDKVSDVGTLS